MIGHFFAIRVVLLSNVMYGFLFFNIMSLHNGCEIPDFDVAHFVAKINVKALFLDVRFRVGLELVICISSFGFLLADNLVKNILINVASLDFLEHLPF